MDYFLDINVHKNGAHVRKNMQYRLNPFWTITLNGILIGGPIGRTSGRHMGTLILIRQKRQYCTVGTKQITPLRM